MHMADLDFFRRQYLVGSRAPTTRDWPCRVFATDFVLAAHPDVQVNDRCVGRRHLIVLGDILDPEYPERNNQQVLDSLFEAFTGYPELEHATFRMGGRWMLLAALGTECRAYPDATGSRPIYFSLVDGEIWLGSLPSVLATEFGFKPSEQLIKDLAATERGDWWPGSLTPFPQVRHSGPNHYLDLLRGASIRFWPDEAIQTVSIDYAAHEIGRLLSGLIRAAANRYSVFIAVTGGYDSRTLIAASGGIHGKIRFYTLAYPGIEQFDLRTPARMAKAFGLNYVTEQFEQPDDKFLESFDLLASRMVRGQCRLNAVSYLRFPSDAVFVEGTASEIIRCFYYRNGKHPQRVDAAALADQGGFGDAPAALLAFEQWLENVPTDVGINMLDLFYWEQRVGNWSAADYQTQEVVRRVLSPFNCRQILIVGLGTSVDMRQEPYELHRRICEQFLPDILRFRFNTLPPKRLLDFLRRAVRRIRRLLRAVPASGR
jgi:hypothetical protein